MPEKVLSSEFSEFFALKYVPQFAPGVPVRLVSEAAKRGEIPIYEVNPKVKLIRKQDFREWLEKFKSTKGNSVNSIVNSVLEGLR